MATWADAQGQDASTYGIYKTQSDCHKGVWPAGGRTAEPRTEAALRRERGGALQLLLPCNGTSGWDPSNQCQRMLTPLLLQQAAWTPPRMGTQAVVAVLETCPSSCATVDAQLMTLQRRACQHHQDAQEEHSLPIPFFSLQFAQRGSPVEAAVETGRGARDLLRVLLALSMGGACISTSPAHRRPRMLLQHAAGPGCQAIPCFVSLAAPVLRIHIKVRWVDLPTPGLCSACLQILTMSSHRESL